MESHANMSGLTHTSSGSTRRTDRQHQADSRDSNRTDRHNQPNTPSQDFQDWARSGLGKAGAAAQPTRIQQTAYYCNGIVVHFSHGHSAMLD
eukprot:1161563-Pelagomonas_calceolata.AAC.8